MNYLQDLIYTILPECNKDFCKIENTILKTFCPLCSESDVYIKHKVPDELNLEVNLETGNYKCNCCNKSGDIKSFQTDICNIDEQTALENSQKIYTVKTYSENYRLPVDLVEKLGITSKNNIISIPYYGENSEIIAIKDLSKNGEFSWHSRF